MRTEWKARLLILFSLGACPGFAAQPVQFPHKTHIKLGLDCVDCHIGADTRAAAGIPSVKQCMLCHQKLAKEKPEVKKVIDYAVKGREIPWERVYGFRTDAMVMFRHAPHARAKVACARCHGDMTQAVVAVKAVSHNMGSCLTCHRQMNASQDCATCHY
jgi:hypothetical protein